LGVPDPQFLYPVISFIVSVMMQQKFSMQLWTLWSLQGSVGKFSTTFFTAHRAPKRAVYSVCKLAPQVGETAKVPHPQNVWPPFSQKLGRWPISEIYSVERGPQPLSISKFRKKVIAGKNVRAPWHEFWVGGTLPPKGASKPQLMGAVVRDLKGHVAAKEPRRYL